MKIRLRFGKIKEKRPLDILGVITHDAESIEMGAEDIPDTAKTVEKMLKDAASTEHPINLRALKTAKGETAAHLAAEYGMDDVLKVVLKYDPWLASAHDGSGNTPLFKAASLVHGPFEDHVKSIETLLSYKVSPDETGFGLATPLHELFRSRNKLDSARYEYDEKEFNRCQSAATKILLAARANINAADSDNVVPIYEAIDNYATIDLVKILLNNDADPHIVARRQEYSRRLPDSDVGYDEPRQNMDTLQLAKFVNYPALGQFKYFVEERNRPEPAPPGSDPSGKIISIDRRTR